MEKYKLFLILKNKEPQQAFIEKNFDRAKLYFQGYIWGENRPFDYKLMQIGTFDKEKLITNNIFITGGFEMTNKTISENQKINQLKMQYDFNLNSSKTNNDLVKEIFEGERIK